MPDTTTPTLPCGGRAGDNLHHADGSLRTTPTSTSGRELDRHAAAIGRHLADHDAATRDPAAMSATACRLCGTERADTTGGCPKASNPGMPAHQYPMPYPIPRGADDVDRWGTVDVAVVPRVSVHTWGTTGDGWDVYVGGRPIITVRTRGADSSRVCQSCGSAVTEMDTHALWHASLNRY